MSMNNCFVYFNDLSLILFYSVLFVVVVNFHLTGIFPFFIAYFYDHTGFFLMDRIFHPLELWKM